MFLDLPAFRPHPLVRGGHLQTIVGNFLPSRVVCRSQVRHVLLPDGDAIALHEDSGAGETAYRDVVVLVHGLGGCHQSTYMMRCSTKLQAQGFRVFRMDLRGCGAGMSLARRPLHAGRSEDAEAVLAQVHELCPSSPIHLVGFSMGGNIVLKLAGELAGNAPPHLASVLAVSPPIDLAQCSESIQRGFSRVYDRRFVRSLVKHVEERDAILPDALTRPLQPRPRQLKAFDSLFTAPLAGFADVDDYYARASSRSGLKQITVPTLIIAAKSDPIVPAAAFEAASYSGSTQVLMTSCGGHLGFISARGDDADCRWIDWRIVDWVASRSCRASTSLPVAHQADHRTVEHAVAPIVQLDGAVS